MRCAKCHLEVTFSLELVRAGHVYECSRCGCGERIVNVHAAADLPRETAQEPGLLVVRLGFRNAYIFDRRLFSRFVRSLVRDLKSGQQNLIVNLEKVAYVPDRWLQGLFRIRRFLRTRGRDLKIVQRSLLFRSIVERLDSAVPEYLFSDEQGALRSFASAGIVGSELAL